jgi:hypothetical protein
VPLARAARRWQKQNRGASRCLLCNESIIISNSASDLRSQPVRNLQPSLRSQKHVHRLHEPSIRVLHECVRKRASCTALARSASQLTLDTPRAPRFSQGLIHRMLACGSVGSPYLAVRVYILLQRKATVSPEREQNRNKVNEPLTIGLCLILILERPWQISRGSLWKVRHTITYGVKKAYG